MRYLLRLSLLLLAGHTTLADLILMSPRSPVPVPEANNENPLERRQFCPYTFDVCYSFNGQFVCQDIDEVCCQLADGTNPYTCPIDHPYCCPSASDGSLLCGSSASCSGPVINGPAAVLPTATTGTVGPASTGGTGKTATVTAATPTATAKSGGVKRKGYGQAAAVLAIAAAML